MSRTSDARRASAGRAFDPGHAPRDLDPAFDERRQVGERAGLEVGAADPGAGQRLPRVGKVVVGLAADRLEERDALARPGQGLADAGRLDERLEPFEAFPPQSRAHLLKQERPDTVELQYFE